MVSRHKRPACPINDEDDDDDAPTTVGASTNVDHVTVNDHRREHDVGVHRIQNFKIRPDPDPAGSFTIGSGRIRICLLYTSDAADE